jgi:hypothetical protein
MQHGGSHGAESLAGYFTATEVATGTSLQDQIEQMVLNVGLSALDCSGIFSVLLSVGLCRE